MSVYLIALCRDVGDRAALERYWVNVAPTFEGYANTPLAVYTPFEQLEGNGSVEGVVLIEFASADIARRWYASEPYQSVKKYREGAAKFDLVLVSGGIVADPKARMPQIK